MVSFFEGRQRRSYSLFIWNLGVFDKMREIAGESVGYGRRQDVLVGRDRRALHTRVWVCDSPEFQLFVTNGKPSTESTGAFVASCSLT